MSNISFKTFFENQLLHNLLPAENKQNFENDDIDSLIEKLEKTNKSNAINNNKNKSSLPLGLPLPLSLSVLLDSIKSKLNNITSETFDKIAVKLFNKIIDIFKETINKLNNHNHNNFNQNSKSNTKIEENYLNLNQFYYISINLITINKFLANFYLIFSKLFQNYNEAHKNIIKNTPNFLKIYFKLFEENLDFIIDSQYQYNNGNGNGNKSGTSINSNSTLINPNSSNDLLKSFLTFIASIMHSQTNMLRPFEVRIENIINKVLSSFIDQPDLKKCDKKLLEISIVIYVSTIYLTNDLNKKFPLIMQRCIDSINFYTKLIKPISIRNKKENINNNNTNTNTNTNSDSKIKDNNNRNIENNFTFFFDNLSLEKNLSLNSIKIKNAIKLIFKILKSLLLSLNNNSNLDFNFKSILGFLIKNLFSEFTNIPENEYIISGLNPSKYNLIISYKQYLSLKMLNNIVELFSPYMIYYIPLLKDVIKSLTLFKNEKTNDITFFEFKQEIILFVKILIEKFDLKIGSFSKEFIQKIAINEFADILICYLEKKDITIVKIDKGFFKLSALNTNTFKNKNNNSNNRKINNISLLDIAKQETFNVKFENYSDIQLENLLINYLDGNK
jgi:hypothetical protein